MIGFVDLAHPDFLADPARRQAHLGRRLDVALRLQEIAGTPCLYQHYSAIDRAFVRRWGLRALVLSGIPSHWRAYDWATFAPLAALIREPEVPILGVCGGSQVIGRLLGAPVTLMGRLQPGEADTGSYMTGWRKEIGFLPLDIETADPLFAGLGPHPELFLFHGRATKAVPQGCTLLASRPTCRVQAFRRDDAPIYAIQAHPELYDDAHPDGRQLLANFFALAGIAPQS